MLQCLHKFQRNGTGGIHKEIVTFISGLIESGELARGQALPSTRKLAALWGTNDFSVRLAIKNLAGMGLVNKQPGRGVYVAPPAAAIRRVGLYFSRSGRNFTDASFFSSLRDILGIKLRQRNFEVDIFDDSRPEEEHNKAPDDLEQAISGNRIQAIIGVILNSYDFKWFDRLPICKVSQMHDFELDFLVPTLKLRETGCKQIAAILSADGNRPNSPILTGFLEAGVDILPRNLHLICEKDLPAQSNAEIGYHATIKLLTAYPQPDALIVYPDSAVQGAIQAILQLGIKVPEQLLTIFHRNIELGYFCPFSAIFLDVSISAIAERIINNLVR